MWLPTTTRNKNVFETTLFLVTFFSKIKILLQNIPFSPNKNHNNFQWKNHSIFKNFCTTSPSVIEPSPCTPPHWELSKDTKNMIWSIPVQWISQLQNNTNYLPSYIDIWIVYILDEYNMNINVSCWWVKLVNVIWMQSLIVSKLQPNALIWPMLKGHFIHSLAQQESRWHHTLPCYPCFLLFTMTLQWMDVHLLQVGSESIQLLLWHSKNITRFEVHSNYGPWTENAAQNHKKCS
jgi:hypothetical protein